MPQQNNDVLASKVAVKINDLVEDRDFLGWNVAPAAQVIEKLISKATDDTVIGAQLCEAGEMLSARCMNDRKRKVLIIREALGVLHAKQDTAKPVQATSPKTARPSEASWGNPPRSEVSASNTSSPFLAPVGGR